LTAAKSERFVFPVLGFALSSVEIIFIGAILCDVWPSSISNLRNDKKKSNLILLCGNI
jgi:hypothetical protein